jgi:hypothetical protein
MIEAKESAETTPILAVSTPILTLSSASNVAILHAPTLTPTAMTPALLGSGETTVCQ